MSMHLFCFGLGFTAQTLAERILAKGGEVSGTVRSEEKCIELAQKGICSYVFPQPSILPPGQRLPEEKLDLTDSLELATHVLLSVPPTDNGDFILQKFGKLLSELKNIEWIGYLSTTGVYGDHQGGWVDENTPVNPPNKRSESRVLAEKKWLESGLPVHIFRLSGIYGKGRSAIEALQNGTARRIDKEGQVFSRIHVEDIATILEHSMAKPNIGAIYNCADDMPEAQEKVVAYAAELLGVEPPPLVSFEEADLTPMARSFYDSNRRVKNTKIKEELGVKLQYPDYKVGLQSIVTA